MNTDEKVFYMKPPINNQNDRVWSEKEVTGYSQFCLLVECAKFLRKSCCHPKSVSRKRSCCISTRRRRKLLLREWSVTKIDGGLSRFSE